MLRDSFRLKCDRLHERATRRGIQLGKRRYRCRCPQHRELHETFWRRKVNVERPRSHFRPLKTRVAEERTQLLGIPQGERQSDVREGRAQVSRGRFEQCFVNRVTLEGPPDTEDDPPAVGQDAAHLS